MLDISVQCIPLRFFIFSDQNYYQLSFTPNSEMLYRYLSISELLESQLSDLMGGVTYQKEKMKTNTQNVMLLNSKPHLVAAAEQHIGHSPLISPCKRLSECSCFPMCFLLGPLYIRLQSKKIKQITVKGTGSGLPLL